MNITNKTDVLNLIQEACAELNYDAHILNAPEAIVLLMGTWACESNGGQYLKQAGGGPALGAWQMEKFTFCDVINRCGVVHNQTLSNTINKTIDNNDFGLIQFDYKLACQVARLKYYLCPGVIPTDFMEIAAYYKKYYNTPLGAGSAAGFIAKYKKYAQ